MRRVRDCVHVTSLTWVNRWKFQKRETQLWKMNFEPDYRVVILVEAQLKSALCSLRNLAHLPPGYSG